MLKDRRLTLGISISILIHIILFVLVSGSVKPSSVSYEDIKEITLIDQSYPPEVAKVISQTSIWKETNSEAFAPTQGREITTPTVDLTAKIDRSQAKMDLDRYLPSEKISDVVLIGNRNNGTMKSTDEILAEKPLSLAKNLPRDAAKEGGTLISGVGSPLETPILKIDKKPPLVKTPEKTKEPQATFDDKLELAKGETKISLAGPLAQRTILEKLLPKYPAWCLSKNISGVVKVKIWVEPSGAIREGTLIEVSSGYPDLDRAVADALKNWRFAPLPQNVIQETQWGIITFKFVCG